MIPKTGDIISFFETEYANIRRQASWDFSGAQIYTGEREIRSVALSLDPDEGIIKKAVSKGCELLITHHPLFFRETRGVNVLKSADRRAVLAIKGGLDILSYHTVLDMCSGGLNDYVLELMGAEIEDGFLAFEGESSIYEFSVFVPHDFKDKILEALKNAGAGSSSKYEGAAFVTEGVGTFTPKPGSSPFIGSVGENRLVDEVKIETVAEESVLPSVIAAVLRAHPYEEPAYSAVKTEKKDGYGFGKVGKLKNFHTLENFIDLTRKVLNTSDIRTNMTSVPPFDRIAVCTGSGASLWKECLKRNVSVLLTGDMKYHDASDAAESGVCVIDAGHQATEEIYLNRMAELLKNRFDVNIFIEKRDTRIVSWG